MNDLEFLSTLEAIIDERATTDDPDSYTARLLALGLQQMAQKVGEEGVEVALAAVTGNDDELGNEAADLIYHLLVLLHARGLSLDDVCAVLRDRHSA